MNKEPKYNIKMNPDDLAAICWIMFEAGQTSCKMKHTKQRKR
jgi:hypothetical protein